jgi:hypothetical protein
VSTTLVPGLRINQRNLYTYFLSHRERYGDTVPCYVPRCPSQASRIPQYLKAIEARGLIRVLRDTPNYTGWLMLPPLRGDNN